MFVAKATEQDGKKAYENSEVPMRTIGAVLRMQPGVLITAARAGSNSCKPEASPLSSSGGC